VATDWGPVIQTGIGAAAAVSGGLLTAWYQARAQERAERYRRKERAAEVVLAAFQLYTDIDSLNDLDPSKSFPEAAERLWARSDRLRTQLWVLGTSHPSSKVRELAREAPSPLTNRLTSAMRYAAVRTSADTAAQKAAEGAAKADGEKALRALSDLMTAIEHD
jgi:hypothetical protein